MSAQFFLKIKGARQGTFVGDSPKNQKNSERLPILGFSYSVQSPRDAASGQASGKRIHHPITIFKEWGSCSPQMFEALATGEILTSVVIHEVRQHSGGEEYVYMEIRLFNAHISAISIDPEHSSDTSSWTHHETEQVSFSFQKIEIENKLSSTAAVDTWSSAE